MKGKPEGDGTKNIKEVGIPTIIVVGEFNVKHNKCRNNQSFYLK